MINLQKTGTLVEAIEGGRIVRVSEDYAKREGLLILRKPMAIDPKQAALKTENKFDKKGFIGFEDLRKPLRVGENDLVDNFQWILVQQRKTKRLMRKQVADAIGETELNLKIIENGVLPENNFILVNKLENYFNIVLRKNPGAKQTSQPLRTLVEKGLEVKVPERKYHLRWKKQETTSAEKPKEEVKNDKVELLFDDPI
jgi:ribosome-binding protein aMBF1 (putative translation factor)